MESDSSNTPALPGGANSAEMPPAPWWKAWVTRASLVKLGLLVALVVAILVAFLGFGVHKRLDDFLEWLQDNKALGFFIFVAVYSLCTVLFVPGLILSLGAGFIFKIPLGMLAVWVAATIGQTLAFLVGRYLLRDWVAARTRNFKVWQGIEAAVEDEGWKIVGLLRLAPLIPYNALNYALGLTAVKFWHYFIASSIGILPGTALYVVIGSLAEDLSKITSGEGAIDTNVLIVTVVLTIVMVVVVVFLTTFYAKRAINKKLEAQKLGDGEAAEGEQPSSFYDTESATPANPETVAISVVPVSERGETGEP
ncbi:unnamed protein product [Ostreobium quekettii]|uniref:VTT domain-containing protein n=1 Tax=Ostreobium quekettii TaxID=121088 RepID=A0A8S1J9U8_9CHLO|nr:unnamed protein product [Ostreobium quekettii]|eukprot:evm.model.scf_1540.3 EVM.evm.TU.scf_1540.3   scf_1540:30147-33729(-)